MRYYDGVEICFCEEISRHKHSGSKVALRKVLMENEKEGFPIAALREIKILQLLRHDNSHPVQQAFSIYLVSDLCEHDLEGLLSNASVKFTLAEIKKVMQMLLNGLYCIHGNKILHRDMKAGNVLITKDGVLKLADFGLAWAFSLAKNSQGNRYTNCVATIWYRPPELRETMALPSTCGAPGASWQRCGPGLPSCRGARSSTSSLSSVSFMAPSLPGVDHKYELYQKTELPRGQKRKVKDRLKAYVKDPCALDLIDKLLVLDTAQHADTPKMDKMTVTENKVIYYVYKTTKPTHTKPNSRYNIRD
uniref:Cyclin-dependent kinase 9 (CDC2-related kinase) n=1 Tax=Myripristis murdjan TaxID=586833 RepID=A0A667WTA5_9TELE